MYGDPRSRVTDSFEVLRFIWYLTWYVHAVFYGRVLTKISVVDGHPK